MPIYILALLSTPACPDRLSSAARSTRASLSPVLGATRRSPRAPFSVRPVLASSPRTRTSDGRRCSTTSTTKARAGRPPIDPRSIASRAAGEPSFQYIVTTTTQPPSMIPWKGGAAHQLHRPEPPCWCQQSWKSASRRRPRELGSRAASASIRACRHCLRSAEKTCFHRRMRTIALACLLFAGACAQRPSPGSAPQPPPRPTALGPSLSSAHGIPRYVEGTQQCGVDAYGKKTCGFGVCCTGKAEVFCCSAAWRCPTSGEEETCYWAGR